MICSIDECENEVQARGWCMKHYLRWYRRGTLDLVGRGRNTWTGDDATYNAVHLRHRKVKGRAGDRKCIECSGPASHWAYDNADPAEKVAPEGRYSTDPDHYQPMCVPCHKAFDTNSRKESACTITTT